ncbi:MAG: hypothetical protein IKH04_08330 [Kiritimatiellae bacterium]|nr:hypothetical protein [Kiritimatiellia bacterium]
MIKEKAIEIWSFFRSAGVLQAVVDAKAFRCLKELPNENWAVLSCPTDGLNFDARTLGFIDGNHDGHIRVEEVLGAIAWMESRVADMADLLGEKDEIAFAAFADTPEGHALAEAAKSAMKSMGKDGADKITLADVLERSASFKAAPFNGDGVLVPAAAAGKSAALLADILSSTGGVADRSGENGVDKASLDAFLASCRAWLAWIDAGAKGGSAVMPLGGATDAAAGALDAVRAKIDDYFERCSLIAFDGAASAPLNSSESDYAAIGLGNVAANAAALEALPLAKAGVGRPLPLGDGVNPQWRGKVADFAAKVVSPILGERAELTAGEWRKVKDAFAPYIAWKTSLSDADAKVASLGEKRVREIVADEKAVAEIEELIAKDLSFSAEIDQLEDLEKLLRYHANLNRFLNNFVNFSDYYNPDRPEIYRAGRLYIDGRVCRECVYVADAGAHSTLAASSKMFLAYCKITRPQTGATRTICAAVTAGFSSTLWVGRNGIFYDEQDNDWNAVIIKICECQTSLKEAFWAPWLKISDLISDQIKKLLSSKETAMMSAATTKVAVIGEEAPPPAAEPKRDGAAMASSVAAIGIAVGIIGSAIGGLVSALKGISFWYGVLGVAAIILAVSGPSVLLAWFKLRSRDFAPVLNACGWAINKKMLMPMRLSRVFTHEAVIPVGSNISMDDPYVEKHFWRNALITVAVLAALAFWVWRWHSEWLPEQLRRQAPAAEVEPSGTGAAECGEEAAEAAGDAAANTAPEAAEG